MRIEQFTGQPDVVKVISTMIAAAKARNASVDHILLWGAPGLGKTTLARAIAETADLPCTELSGPTLDKRRLLLELMKSVRGKIIVIDEIHSMNRETSEVLYSAMDDFVIYLSGTRIGINPFTLIGTTTEPAMIPLPLRSRFRVELHLDYYCADDLATIVAEYAASIGIDIGHDAAMEIARRSRETPRVAKQLTAMVANFAAAEGVRKPSRDQVSGWLDVLVDKSGLTRQQIQYLQSLAMSGGSIGLNTLAGAIGESAKSIVSAIEPYLLRRGLVEVTPRGRKVTDEGLVYLVANGHL